MSLAILNSHSTAFRRFLDAMFRRRGTDGASIDAAVAKIIAAVRRRGDRALVEFSARFDRVRLTPARLRVRPA
jgi:histidinol dehydrogenase